MFALVVPEHWAIVGVAVSLVLYNLPSQVSYIKSNR